MEGLVKCLACGQIQHALIIQDGKLFAFDGDNVGSQITGFKCSNCGQVIHWGVHKAQPRRKKILAR